MSTYSELIIELLSYSLTDLVVSSKDEARIIKLVRSDPSLGATMQELQKKRYLDKLFSRVDSGGNHKLLVQAVAGGIANSSHPLMARTIAKYTAENIMFERCFALQSALKRYGLTASPTSAYIPALRAALSKLRATAATQPFSGSGATGIDPKSLTMSTIDKALLMVKHGNTVAQYSNPIPGSLSAYLRTLTADQRKTQAIVMLQRPIISVYKDSYNGHVPTRANVMRTAGKKYNLEPALIAAFVLAEQRDQTSKEDAKDYIAATEVNSNTSIGLGQVLVSTARSHGLFDDLLTAHLSKSLSHDEIASMLTSDEFNLFAVAKYIRHVADTASSLSLSSLPNTVKEFPKINLSVYKNNSRSWPDDNIRALASEYTSRAWDDRVSSGWGFFVYEAYKDISGSGVL